MTKLFLIPTSLGEGGPVFLPEASLEVIRELDFFVAERAKTARRFLKKAGTKVPFDSMTFFELNKRTQADELEDFLDIPLKAGKNVGLLSEAGCPGVADPGARIVAMAHRKGIEVIPIVGPSSILLSLMASGMNGQSFCFHGYLPIESKDRKKSLSKLEARALSRNETQIFIETPYRNNALIKDALEVLKPQTGFGIAADLTQENQYILSKQAREWQKEPPPDLHKRPAVFLIGKLS